MLCPVSGIPARDLRNKATHGREVSLSALVTDKSQLLETRGIIDKYEETAL